MFLLKSNLRKDVLILLITSILLGTILVQVGGYLTDRFFGNMVSGVIGEYGEYDLLLTVSTDKEDIAVREMKSVIGSTLKGAVLKEGQKVAGTSSYLLKLPVEYKNEATYTKLGLYFADIPGVTSKTIITEPRLTVRGFQGDTLPVLRPLIEEVRGIGFLYPNSDGLDIIVERPELLPEVKNRIDQVLSNYHLLEIRYPLNQHPEDLPGLREEIYNLIAGDLTGLYDVTRSNSGDRVSLLTSLKQMKTFLLSYAAKVVVKLPEEAAMPEEGEKLLALTADGRRLGLEVIEVKGEGRELTALIQQGEPAGTPSGLVEVYLRRESAAGGDSTAPGNPGTAQGNVGTAPANNAVGAGQTEIDTGIKGEEREPGKEAGRYLGRGEINNPRQDLADSLDKLNEITPILNGFLKQSEQLVGYSEKLSSDLSAVNQGLEQLKGTSEKLSSSLQEWEKQGLSSFLNELIQALDELKTNASDITHIQRDLIKTSNRLKEGAGLIAEKLVFVPRNNSLYQQLNELKDLFLQIANGLDTNYDLVANRLDDMGPVLASIDVWKGKLNSLLRVEETLNSGADWTKVDDVIQEIDRTSRAVDIGELQQQLSSVQELLTGVKTTQLPVVINQLSYIQNSLPDLREAEIVETIKLIDSYIAGQVIPGDQIQLLIKGRYDAGRLEDKIRPVIKNPAVSYISLDAGYIAPNPRGELFNILSQVRAVITAIIALVFTLLVMILDQSLLISIIKLNNGRGYLYGFLSGGLLFSLISRFNQISFPYLDFKLELLIGGVLGLLITMLSGMLNPVNREEWEAGKALGFSPAEIMHQVIIPAGKPGLLYLLNYPRVIFK